MNNERNNNLNLLRQYQKFNEYNKLQEKPKEQIINAIRDLGNSNPGKRKRGPKITTQRVVNNVRPRLLKLQKAKFKRHQLRTPYNDLNDKTKNFISAIIGNIPAKIGSPMNNAKRNKWVANMQDSIVINTKMKQVSISHNDSTIYDLLLLSFLDARHDFNDDRTNKIYSNLVTNTDSFMDYLKLVCKQTTIDKIKNMLGPNNKRFNTRLFKLLAKKPDPIIKKVTKNGGGDIIVQSGKVEDKIRDLIQRVGGVSFNMSLKGKNVTRYNAQLPSMNKQCVVTASPVYKIPRLCIDALSQNVREPMTAQGIPYYGTLANFMDMGKDMTPDTPNQWIRKALTTAECNGKAVICSNELNFQIGGFLSGQYWIQDVTNNGQGNLSFKFMDTKNSAFKFPPRNSNNLQTNISSAGNITKNESKDITTSFMSKFMGDFGQIIGILANPSQANMFASFDNIACLIYIYMSNLVGRFPSLCHWTNNKATFYYPTDGEYDFIFGQLFAKNGGGYTSYVRPGTMPRDPGIPATNASTAIPSRNNIQKVFNTIRVNSNNNPTTIVNAYLNNRNLSNNMKGLLQGIKLYFNISKIDRTWNAYRTTRNTQKKEHIKKMFNIQKGIAPRAVMTQKVLLNFNANLQTATQPQRTNLLYKLEMNYVVPLNENTKTMYNKIKANYSQNSSSSSSSRMKQ